MKIKGVYRGVAISFLIITVLFTLLCPSSYASSTLYAKLETFSGDVVIIKNTGEKSFKAFKGMSLSEGDEIITGKSSEASLAINEDKKISIGSDTKITIKELKKHIDGTQSNLKLKNGKVIVNITKKLKGGERFDIQTPTAVMGVRGTIFYVSTDDKETKTVVIEGKVQLERINSVQSDAPIILKKNEEVTFKEESQDSNAFSVVKKADITQLEHFALEVLKSEEGRVDSEIINGDTLDQLLEEKRIEDVNPSIKTPVTNSENMGNTINTNERESRDRNEREIVILPEPQPQPQPQPQLSNLPPMNVNGLTLTYKKSAWFTEGSNDFTRYRNDPDVTFSIVIDDPTIISVRNPDVLIVDYFDLSNRDMMNLLALKSGETTLNLTVMKPGYEPIVTDFNVKVDPLIDKVYAISNAESPYALKTALLDSIPGVTPIDPVPTDELHGLYTFPAYSMQTVYGYSSLFSEGNEESYFYRKEQIKAQINSVASVGQVTYSVNEAVYHIESASNSAPITVDQLKSTLSHLGYSGWDETKEQLYVDAINQAQDGDLNTFEKIKTLMMTQ